MKINTMYVVLKPTPVSELADILFEADLYRLCLQFLGGQKPDGIHAIYTGFVEAEDEAGKLLKARDKEEAMKAKRKAKKPLCKQCGERPAHPDSLYCTTCLPFYLVRTR